MRSQKVMSRALLCAGSVFALFMWSSCIGLAADYKFFDDYGDFTAGNLNFKDVTEASLTNSHAVYGSPTVSGDSISFDLEGVGAFNIKEEDGGFDFVDGQLTVTFDAKDGAAIHKVAVSEYGDYSLFGKGTSDTSISVGIGAMLRISEINGVSVNPFTVQLDTNVDRDLVSNKGLAQVWSGLLNFDVDKIVADKGYTGSATMATLTFDNALYAFSEAKTGAYVAKKMVDINVTTDASPVPEPGTFALAGMGLITLLGYVWRKRRA